MVLLLTDRASTTIEIALNEMFYTFNESAMFLNQVENLLKPSS